jgi:hypothetical protein
VALPLSILYIMRPLLAELAQSSGASVLSLGYPDLLADTRQLTELFGGTLRGKLEVRQDSTQMAAFHSSFGLDHVVETVSLFTALGLKFDCIDVQRARGVERIVDLNHPLPEDLVGRYSLVLDLGTIEHCFNIGQAIANAAQAVAPGGYVMHTNPMSMFNHGFYNLNPTFYHDFYSQNGFEVLFMNALANVPGNHDFREVPPVARFASTLENAAIVVVARRRLSKPIVWPVQSKYRDAIAANGARKLA